MTTLLDNYTPLTSDNATNLGEIIHFQMRWITEVDWSPNGQQLAVANAANLTLYRFEEGRIVRQQLPGHQEPIRSTQFSPDGTWLATGGDEGTARLWSLAPDEPRRCYVIQAGAPVQQVRYSPNGAWLAGVVKDHVHVWPTTGQFTPRFTLTGHSGDVTSVAYHPAGDLMATGSWDQTVRLWSAADGTLLQTWTGPTARLNQVRFTPDGTHLAAVDRDGVLWLWEIETGREIATLTGHGGRAVDVVQFSHDGRLMLTGGRDFRAKVWDFPTRELIVALPENRKPVIALALHPAGLMVATGSGDHYLRLYGIRLARPE